MSSPSPTSAVRVHSELRQAILSGSLAPGARLRTDKLAQRLKTSRTPVREALMLLAREGLVEIEPRRGAVVSPFDAADLLDRYHVRSLVEPAIAKRAATRISAEAIAALEELCELSEARGCASDAAIEDQIRFTEQFHRTIVEAAESPRLAAALGAVAGIPHAFSTLFWMTDSQREASQFCHRRLLSALADGKPALCEAVMQMHIVGATEFLAEIIGADEEE